MSSRCPCCRSLRDDSCCSGRLDQTRPKLLLLRAMYASTPVRPEARKLMISRTKRMRLEEFSDLTSFDKSGRTVRCKEK